jgi:translation elongation factor EF-1alpha
VRTGKIRAGEKLTILPSYLPAQALTLTDLNDTPIAYACAGMQVKITLNCTYPEDLATGNFLVARAHNDSLLVTQTLKAEI